MTKILLIASALVSISSVSSVSLAKHVAKDRKPSQATTDDCRLEKDTSGAQVYSPACVRKLNFAAGRIATVVAIKNAYARQDKTKCDLTPDMTTIIVSPTSEPVGTLVFTCKNPKDKGNGSVELITITGEFGSKTDGSVGLRVETSNIASVGDEGN